MLWGLAKLRLGSGAFGEAATAELQRRGLRGCAPPELSALVWSLSKGAWGRVAGDGAAGWAVAPPPPPTPSPRNRGARARAAQRE